MPRPSFQSGSWKEELCLIGLFLAVLGVGTAVILNPADAYIGPGLAFDQLGLRLAVGLGFGPTAVVPPLYPHYLALFYGWIGYSHQAVLLSQVVLLGGLASVVALSVRYLGLGPRYAWLAGALTGFFPQALALLRHFSPTLLIALLWGVGLLSWIRSRPRPAWFEAVFAGLVWGAALLGRFALWAPLLVLLFSRPDFRPHRRTFQTNRLDRSPAVSGDGAGLRGESGRGPDEPILEPDDPCPPALEPRNPQRRAVSWRLASCSALAATVLLAVVVPWIVRNSQLYDELVFVDSTWAVRWRAATIPGEHTLDYIIPGRTTQVPDHMPVLENRLALGDVIGFACAQPGTLLRVWARRARSLVGFSGWNDAATLDRFPYEGPAYRTLQALLYGLLLSLALSWWILLRARGTPERLLGRTWVALVTIGTITGGIGDIRIYTLPVLLPLAMRGLWGLLVQLRVRLRPRKGEPGSLWQAYPNLDPLPFGVERATPLRWGLYLGLVVGIWGLGLYGL